MCVQSDRVRVVLDAGADPNDHDETTASGVTPLKAAATEGIFCFQFLLFFLGGGSFNSDHPMPVARVYSNLTISD